MEAYIIPKSGTLPAYRPLVKTSIVELQHILVHSFYETLNKPANKVFESVGFSDARLIHYYVNKIIVEYDDTAWRSSRVAWYGWIEFDRPMMPIYCDGITLGSTMKEEVPEPLRIGASIDAELYAIQNIKYDTAEEFKQRYGAPMALAVRNELVKLTKARPHTGGWVV